MSTTLTPKEALQALKNKARGTCSRSSATPNLPTQSPYAAILSCADSRVIPEDIFCAEAGDLFVVRTAGNVADVVGIASLEFAVAELGVPLIVVMGHKGCGAVNAARKFCKKPCKKIPSPSLGQLINQIIPAIYKCDPEKMKIRRLEDAVKANVELSAKTLLAESMILRKAFRSKKLIIAGAYYTMQGEERKKNVQWIFPE